jgi:hypothetical protein
MYSPDGSTGKVEEPVSDELDSYRPVSRLAVAGMIAGAGSATALLGLPLWVVPLVGILLSSLALVRINRSAGQLAGRSMALAGMGLAVVFGSAALAGHFNSKRIVAEQAREAAEPWFRTLAKNEPELAHQLVSPPTDRARQFDVESLRTFYQNDKKKSDKLEKFVDNPVIKALLALGPRAHVEFESTVDVDNAMASVTQRYRVSWQEDGKTVQFPIQLMLLRFSYSGYPTVFWRVADWGAIGPIPPVPSS